MRKLDTCIYDQEAIDETDVKVVTQDKLVTEFPHISTLSWHTHDSLVWIPARWLEGKVNGKDSKYGTRTASEGEKNSVVEAKPKLRHARQHGLQFDTAHNITTHHTAICIHLQQNTVIPL